MNPNQKHKRTKAPESVVCKALDRYIAELEDYGLDIRAISALERNYGDKIFGLMGVTYNELRQINGIGQKRAKQVGQALLNLLNEIKEQENGK